MGIMAVGRSLLSLGKLALVALVAVPLLAIWLSGALGQEAGPDPGTPAPATLATLPRTDTVATAAPRLPLLPDSIPTAAPPVTVGAGRVTVPPSAAGAAPVPVPNAGTVVGEPRGLPDPNRSEAIPKPSHR
jgi:hypothetical protein